MSRTSRLTKALSLLESSLQKQPSSSAHFHIALALHRPIPGRDLGRAIENARLAVELEPDNIRYWHLLGLLLVASEDWRGARDVLEAVAELDDQAWMAEQNPFPGDDVPDSNTIGRERKSTADVTTTADASLTRPESSQASEEASIVTERPHERVTVLDGESDTLPPAAELLQPLPDHPPPSIADRFEHALQLRMTQLALAELIEGPEGTEERWIEVFQWFAARKGPERDQSRETAHAGFLRYEAACVLTYLLTERTSIETASRSLEAKSATYDPRSLTSFQNDANGIYAPKPVPIAATPTTAAHDENGTAMSNGTPKISIEDSEKEKEKDKSAGKKVQKMLKNRVHKEQRRISTIGRKIGHGVGRQRGGLNLRRTSSTPGKGPLSLYFLTTAYSGILMQPTCTR